MTTDWRIIQDEINKDALANPKPGDLWRERISIFICLVVQTNEYSVLVQRKTKPAGPNHYVIDFNTPPEVLTLKGFRELVKYADMNVREEDRPALLAEYDTKRWKDHVRLLDSAEEVRVIDDRIDPEVLKEISEEDYRRWSFKNAMDGLRKACKPPPQMRHRDGYHWLRHTTISPEYKLAKWCAARQGWVGGPNKGILELSSMSWHSVDQLI